MSQSPKFQSLDDIPSATYSLVAPFAADIDTSQTGSIRYRVYQNSESQLDTISSYIRSTLRVSFVGNWMLIADWYFVPLRGGPTVSYLHS